MEIVEIHKYDRMPVASPTSADKAFDALFEGPTLPRRERSALLAHWRSWRPSSGRRHMRQASCLFYSTLFCP